jgi:intracellular septation protein
MKLFFDFLPILIFFIAYKLGGIYIATAFAMLAALAQIIVSYFRTRKIEIMPLITFLMVMLLGGATLFLHNEIFIKWKPTIVYWVLSMVFLLSPLVLKKPLVQKMLESNLVLPSKAWQILNAAWYLFFLVMGFLNLFVVYNFSTETWVNFKLFGTLGLTLLFVLGQGVIISRFLPEKTENKRS